MRYHSEEGLLRYLAACKEIDGISARMRTLAEAMEATEEILDAIDRRDVKSAFEKAIEEEKSEEFGRMLREASELNLRLDGLNAYVHAFDEAVATED